MQQRILIIDDSEDDLALAKSIISRIRPDLIVEAAMSGNEGLELIRNGEILPSLVLLDLKMPRMGGIEVLQKIRADRHFRQVPVVVLTNSDLESDRVSSIKAGADDFLQKASSIDQFKVDMEGVLKRWSKAPGAKS